MTPLRRWLTVVLVAAAVAAVPLAPRLWPVGSSEVSAPDLLSAVQDGVDHPWSGYVETRGTLSLPVADSFESIGSLLGEQNRMRVWWRGSQAWRVDRLLTAGESDLVHVETPDGGPATLAYSYEGARATVSRDPDIRLPRASDLLPNEVARRFLADVDPDDVARIDVRRVAGVAAPGLRLAPPAGDERSTVDHLDVWADPASGVPLRVEVWARGAGSAAYTAQVRSFSSATPPAARVGFSPTPTTDLARDDVLDIADAANRYAPVTPPARMVGLERTGNSRGAVGVYGSGLEQLVAIPLRGKEADALREQVRSTPGVHVAAGRVAVTVGPLAVLVSGPEGEGGWLVSGTLAEPVLADAARALETRAVFNDRADVFSESQVEESR